VEREEKFNKQNGHKITEVQRMGHTHILEGYNLIPRTLPPLVIDTMQRGVEADKVVTSKWVTV